MLPRGSAVLPGFALPGGDAVPGVLAAGPFGQTNRTKGLNANNGSRRLRRHMHGHHHHCPLHHQRTYHMAAPSAR